MANPNEFFTKLVWANLWDRSSKYYLPKVILDGAEKDGKTVAGPLGDLSIPKLPPSGNLELMKSHNLADWLPIKTGYIGIKFDTVNITGLDSVSDGGLDWTTSKTDPATEGSISAKINVPGITVSGHYVVVATGLAGCALDTAGALSFLPGGAAEASAFTEGEPESGGESQLDKRLDAARAQRSKLWQTPGGGKLMDAYYEHNEQYNYLYQNKVALQSNWTTPTNKYFSNSTYEATQPGNEDKAVNDGNDPDSGKSYNENAFQQALALSTAALYQSQKENDKWAKASEAVLDFKGVVNTKTGNTSDETKAYSVNQTYQTIAENADAPPIGVASKFGAVEMAQPLLTEKEQAFVDQFQKQLEEEDAKFAVAGGSDASATLVQGTFSLSVSGAVLTLNADLTFPSGGGAPTSTVSTLDSQFSVNTIEIKNISDWTAGKLASIGHEIDQALENAQFIRNLLHDKVSDQLGSDTVKDYLTTWMNDTFKKILGPLVGE